MNQKLMKKSLITLAVLGAFAGAAQAQAADQSVVTLYGSFDAGVRRVDAANANGDSRTTMGSNGQYNSNRIGFKGTEDLGGGNNAHFDLEIGFNSGTGQLDTATNRNNLFDRSAYVGMGGSWGSLDLGRQYSVSFKTIGAYDPFNYKYTGIIPLAGAAAGTSYYPTASATYYGGTRFNNDVQYNGTFGPVTVRAEYALGEVTGSTSNGAAQAIGLAYAGGPLSIAAAYTEKKPNIAASGAANYQQNKQFTVGGAFTMGPGRIAVGYIEEKNATGTSAGDGKIKNTWGGGSFDITPAVGLTLAVYQTKGTLSGLLDAKKTLYIGGVTYAFSKRTNFYADIDQAKYSGGININGKDKQNGLSVGINTTF